MEYLSYDELLSYHEALIQVSGGLSGIRDENGLRSAIEQPQASMFGADLYKTLLDKAVALCYSLVKNHGFVDGNKRIGHAAMGIFLQRNGFEIVASVDEQEALILGVAAGTISRESLADWVSEHLVAIED